MVVASSSQFIAQVASIDQDVSSVVRTNLTVSRHPDGSLVTVKGEIHFSDARRVEVREILTVDDPAGNERLSHRLRFPPSGTFARRMKYMDGGTQLVRIEDDLHGLHFHFDDPGKACCSRDKRRVELSDGPAEAIAEVLGVVDVVRIIDQCYYSANEYFCKQFTGMGLVATAVR